VSEEQWPTRWRMQDEQAPVVVPEDRRTSAVVAGLKPLTITQIPAEILSIFCRPGERVTIRTSPSPPLTMGRGVTTG
jgi:hypothetical protein